MRKDYPEMLKVRSIEEMNKTVKYTYRPSWEDDILKRLLRKCQKDLQTLALKNESENKKERKA